MSYAHRSSVLIFFPGFPKRSPYFFSPMLSRPFFPEPSKDELYCQLNFPYILSSYPPSLAPIRKADATKDETPVAQKHPYTQSSTPPHSLSPPTPSFNSPLPLFLLHPLFSSTTSAPKSTKYSTNTTPDPISILPPPIQTLRQIYLFFPNSPPYSPN